ncbi:hypothetical protein PVAP13_3NG258070 [Panicum virgatum]|uniref:Uncharacterized protein n=1 Tax=Panicum virgatum TaxID=38727 RepID=A0A8T0U7C8_PANVG|nr:hypothetical protein PVAP13_3NG258070 [Panicum virgatum]
MATTKTILHPLVFVLALTMLVALAHGSFFVFKINVFKHCMGVIKKDPPQSHDPSKKCKKVVEDSNLVGICSVLTEQDEQQISVERLVSLGRKYDKVFPPGARCGTSYIIPELPGPPLL